MNTSQEAPAAMRLEVLYSGRTTADDYDYTITSGPFTRRFKGHVDYTLQYMEVPVLLAVRASKELSIHVGGAAAMLISASSRDKGTETWEDIHGGSGSHDYDDKVNSIEDLSKMSADLVLGGSYEMMPGFDLGARYLFDLNDLDKGMYVSAKSSVFQLSVGYAFGGAEEAGE